jgi:hypothetical protein
MHTDPHAPAKAHPACGDVGGVGAGAGERAGKSKVAELEHTRGSDEQILGLDVAVDNVVLCAREGWYRRACERGGFPKNSVLRSNPQATQIHTVT